MMEHLQPQLAEILRRYRIPVAEAEQILEELFLVLYLKRDVIECPERWLVLSLKNRCLTYWRTHRERLCRRVDRGLLDMLASPQIPETEKDGVRRSLERMLGQLSEECRSRLQSRYGLKSPEQGGEGPTDEEVLFCLEALTRSIVSDDTLRDLRT